MAPSWGGKAERYAARSACCGLFDFPATLLPVSFTRQRLFNAQFLARLQVERMPLDLFNDVFLLHLTLEAPEGVLQSFTFLESDFSQKKHLLTDHGLNAGGDPPWY
jgi:hypothetical protein